MLFAIVSGWARVELEGREGGGGWRWREGKVEVGEGGGAATTSHSFAIVSLQVSFLMKI